MACTGTLDSMIVSYLAAAASLSASCLIACLSSGSTGWKYCPVTSLGETFVRSYMRLEGVLDLVAAHRGQGDGRLVNTLMPARAHALYTRRWSQQPDMV